MIRTHCQTGPHRSAAATILLWRPRSDIHAPPTGAFPGADAYHAHHSLHRVKCGSAICSLLWYLLPQSFPSQLTACYSASHQSVTPAQSPTAATAQHPGWVPSGQTKNPDVSLTLATNTANPFGDTALPNNPERMMSEILSIFGTDHCYTYQGAMSSQPDLLFQELRRIGSACRGFSASSSQITNPPSSFPGPLRC